MDGEGNAQYLVGRLVEGSPATEAGLSSPSPQVEKGNMSDNWKHRSDKLKEI